MNTKIVYTALISLLSIYTAFSQWVQTGGPYGTTKITAVFTNNSRIYAATSCGLHSTGSLTDHWDLKSPLQLETLIKKGNDLYFGGIKSGIQRLDLSEPGFVPVPAGLQGVNVITLTDEGTCLYAGIEGQGFCSSTGYSSVWNFHNTGLPAEVRYYPPAQGGGSYFVRHVNSIAMIDNTIFVATHAGVYQAEKETFVWSNSGAGLPVGNVQQIKVMEGILFACQGNSLFYSADKGESWNLIYRTGTNISSLEKINNYLFITTLGSGIYVSEDNGLTWNTRNEGLTDLNVTTLTLVENSPVCGTANEGIFYYNGSSWVNHSKGIICSEIRSMGITDNTLVANDWEHVYQATGKTNSWSNISPAMDKNHFGFITTMGNRIFLSYLGKDNLPAIQYYESNNSWQELKTNVPFAFDDPYKMSVNGNRLYVYEDGSMSFSDDLGATWGNLTLPDEFCNNIYGFVVYKNIPLAASCGPGELLRLSADREWELFNTGLPAGREITSMAFSENALYAWSYTNGLYVSRDDGQSWTPASNGLYADWDIRSFASYKDHIFVSTVKGVYYSSDFGQNWYLMNEGLKNMQVGPLVIYNDTLYAGTRGNGIWKHDLFDFLPPKEDTTVQIQHIKIFPNPATEYVRFDFNDVVKAQIKLLDILGREMISTNLDSERQISVKGLSSGTYIIVVSTDQYVFTSKLIIEKRE